MSSRVLNLLNDLCQSVQMQGCIYDSPLWTSQLVFDFGGVADCTSYFRIIPLSEGYKLKQR